MKIKNSSGKEIGFTTIEENRIIIHNNTKPELYITKKEDVQKIQEKNREDSFIQYLYDNYLLTVGEIASLYDVCYSNINKQIRKLDCQSATKQGRRNRSYGKKQSKAQREKASQTIKKLYQEGRYKNIQPYERTQEIKEKISKKLKEYYLENPQNPEPHRKNWERGRYDKVDFHRGIGGCFLSKTNKKKIYFRSLLELYFMLNLEEKGFSYQYEPFHIRCEDGTIYTPDLLVNNELIELKSKKYLKRLGAEALKKVMYKKEQAQKYCLKEGLNYKIIYDEDIGFDSSQMKRHLKNHPEIIEEYNIIFNQPERMVIK